MAKMHKKKDLHIAILQYGKDRLESGVTFEELRRHIAEAGYTVSTERLGRYFWDSYETLDLDKRGNSADMLDPEVRSSLRVESTFRIIEYQEFVNANRSSVIAMTFATAALVVSIISAFMSIYYSNEQLNSAVTIDQDQLNDILKISFDDDEINRKLAQIIQYQELLDERKTNDEGSLRPLQKLNNNSEPKAEDDGS